MRHFFILLTLLSSLSAYAKKSYGDAYNQTIKENIVFQEEALNLIGGRLVNRHDKSEILGHCSEINKISECETMNYILHTQNKYFQLIDRNGNPAIVNLSNLKGKIATEYFELNSSYERNAGDFTGALAMNCAYNKAACPLLILLPLSIAADLIMLPADLIGPKIAGALNKESKRVRYTSKIIYDEVENSKKLSHRNFNLFLDSISEQ